jgi:hypothetical protein
MAGAPAVRLAAGAPQPTHRSSITDNVVKKTIVSALALLVLATAGTRSLEARGPASYVIVVSAANPTTSLSRDQASKLFLKKVPTWQNGRDVVPVDLPEGSAVREAFTKDVLRKSVTAVKSYWQQQIFSGRGVPPTEKATDDAVLAYLRANPNAIGYVAANTPLGSGAKVVVVTEK